MNLDFIFVLGCLIAGNIAAFSFLWGAIHQEEQELEEWQEDQREAIEAIR